MHLRVLSNATALGRPLRPRLPPALRGPAKSDYWFSFFFLIPVKLVVVCFVGLFASLRSSTSTVSVATSLFSMCRCLKSLWFYWCVGSVRTMWTHKPHISQSIWTEKRLRREKSLLGTWHAKSQKIQNETRMWNKKKAWSLKLCFFFSDTTNWRVDCEYWTVHRRTLPSRCWV